MFKIILIFLFFRILGLFINVSQIICINYILESRLFISLIIFKISDFLITTFKKSKLYMCNGIDVFEFA